MQGKCAKMYKNSRWRWVKYGSLSTGKRQGRGCWVMSPTWQERGGDDVNRRRYGRHWVGKPATPHTSLRSAYGATNNRRAAARPRGGGSLGVGWWRGDAVAVAWGCGGVAVGLIGINRGWELTQQWVAARRVGRRWELALGGAARRQLAAGLGGPQGGWAAAGLDEADAGFGEGVDLVLGPDGGLHFADVGFLEDEHAEAALADTAAYRQR